MTHSTRFRYLMGFSSRFDKCEAFSDCFLHVSYEFGLG